MDAFDADVLIYAAVPVHRLGRRVRALFPVHATTGGARAGIGSVLLLPELLTKPMRDGVETELEAFTAQLGRIDLRPVDPTIAELATALGATHRLRAADAVHLATAVAAGTDRFITNNSTDSTKTISEVAPPRAPRTLTTQAALPAARAGVPPFEWPRNATAIERSPGAVSTWPRPGTAPRSGRRLHPRPASTVG
jgi:predicted nucleic acid-binding protein